MVSEIKKEAAKVAAKVVVKSQFTKVVVLSEKFGTYSKGDVIVMHNTTAAACIKNKVVKKQ